MQAIPKLHEHSTSRASIVSVLKEAGEVFRFCSRRTKILASLAWDNSLLETFFRNKESALPKPEYEIDKKELQECIDVLKRFAPKIQGEHPVYLWLRRMQESFMRGTLLLLEVGKGTFFEISTELYGNSQTKAFNSSLSNLELARAIAARLSVCSLNDIGESSVEQGAEEFAGRLEKRLSRRRPNLEVKVELTDSLVAKVIAGMSRVRIRKDARFSDLELNALWNHEIESHCLTAHNGDVQPTCNFLQAGGPRTTLTQEGLAVFYEVYGHTMSQRRFISLCDRIEAVHNVESGADFIELYRWYCERMVTPLEAFYATQRIFRGGNMKGGTPFTKDTVYLAGLFGVYNFLRLAVKNQNRLLVESLVCGRIALEDAAVVAWLRAHGIIDPPKFVPDWLKNWEALLSFFSLSAVLGNMDMSSFQDYFDDFSVLEDWDLEI